MAALGGKHYPAPSLDEVIHHLAGDDAGRAMGNIASRDEYDWLTVIAGEVRFLSADLGFRLDGNPHSRLFDQNLGGGCLLDVGIYPVWLPDGKEDGMEIRVGDGLYYDESPCPECGVWPVLSAGQVPSGS